MTGFLELGKYRWFMTLADGDQKCPEWYAILSS